MFVFVRNSERYDQRDYMEAQWRAYFGSFTTLTLDEAYESYLKKTRNASEAQLFEQIAKMTGGHENPYCARLLPDVTSEDAKEEDRENLRIYLSEIK